MMRTKRRAVSDDDYINWKKVKIMLTEAMELIDTSIEKIRKKLDENNDEEWTQVDQMIASITVNKLFSENIGPKVWNYLSRSLCNKYDCVLKERILGKVIPSLEGKKNDKSLVKEILEEWALFEIYLNNVQIMFKPADELGRLPTVSPILPWSLRARSKHNFCIRVWGKFSCEIDHLLNEMNDSSERLHEDSIKFVLFYYEMGQATTATDIHTNRSLGILKRKMIL
ncbi:uncharacterized protein LOC133035106 [Cannabis sativa]|uniref:uncharacterized protein LOC133035106 n=1 Tax=Cannabis sativa TaxID=3483 RepID=UPI0029CA719E|nr:uncharacterized protein LOC133035106 [Cannabis sativa]XP_060966814.1 uncharacterized protein LOC133035106 [Cannabis sativa]